MNLDQWMQQHLTPTRNVLPTAGPVTRFGNAAIGLSCAALMLVFSAGPILVCAYGAVKFMVQR